MYKDSKVPIVIVAGISQKTRAIGNDNQLLFHVPEDLKRFKKLTIGHPIIMGRKTFESIVEMLGKPLPGRENIVITRDVNYQYPGIKVTHSLDEALEYALSLQPQEIHFGGGADIYQQALPYTDRLHLTLYASDKEGDSHFPEYGHLFAETNRQGPFEYQGLTYHWIDYTRRD